jgi:hypothetical protein
MKHTGIPSSSYQPAQLLQLPSRSLGLTLGLAPTVARPWTPCIIVLIVKIWNVLDVNRPGDYICVCLTCVASTELETVGNDSCSIPEELQEEEESLYRKIDNSTKTHHTMLCYG